jgi:hypothetical protein
MDHHNAGRFLPLYTQVTASSPMFCIQILLLRLVGWYSLNRVCHPRHDSWPMEKPLPCRALCIFIPWGLVVEKRGRARHTACRVPPHRFGFFVSMTCRTEKSLTRQSRFSPYLICSPFRALTMNDNPLMIMSVEGLNARRFETSTQILFSPII